MEKIHSQYYLIILHKPKLEIKNYFMLFLYVAVLALDYKLNIFSLEQQTKIYFYVTRNNMRLSNVTVACDNVHLWWYSYVY